MALGELAARPENEHRLATWAPALLVLAASVVGVAWLGLRPVPEAPIAALFPPWWNGEQVFAAAAAARVAVVREGAWPTILVVAGTGPDAMGRLRKQGAWLLLDAQALDACLKQREKI